MFKQKLQQIQALSFDLDDTLWPLMPAILQAEQAQWAWLAEHYPELSSGLTRKNAAAIRENLLVDSSDRVANVSWMRQELLRRLAEKSGLSGAAAEHMSTGAFEVFLQARCNVRPFDDAVEVIPRLAKRFRLVAITNGNADVFATELGEYFEFSLSPVSFPTAKPEPGIFYEALNRLEMQPAQVLHIGDSPTHDIVGARSIGMPTALMQHQAVDTNANGEWRNAALPEGERGADAEITSLYELEALLT